ncbi:MAG: hypothetical protein BWY74_04244 [Firmicutes bacterium ADurb.Bin419]|nr:MAG: hypothetical protein BWY74_04244 [Firmicutes bacterium ADurb.Bin419]
MDISCDSSNIEVYVWNRDAIKFEITRRIRGAYKKEILLEKLEDFYIDIINDNDSVSLKTNYTGSRKKSLETSVDLKVYIPRKIESMNYKIDYGSIKFFDDIRGVLNADLDNADIEINRLDGILNITGNVGNVKVSGGKMSGSSSICILDGNISVKAEFDETGEYIFSTRRGCIEVCAPSDSKVGFDTVGKLEANEFGGKDKASKVWISSEIGSIVVRKY